MEVSSPTSCLDQGQSKLLRVSSGWKDETSKDRGFPSPLNAFFQNQCNFEVYVRPSGKSRTYCTPLPGELPSASAARIQVRSYSCDYSKWTCLNSRGLSWSFYQGQRIIKLTVMRTVWKYAYVTGSGLAVPLGLVSPLGYSPACCARIQTLDLLLEFLWGRDKAQANAPVCFLYPFSKSALETSRLDSLTCVQGLFFCLILYQYFHC